jgi:HlyD family secretion protein
MKIVDCNGKTKVWTIEGNNIRAIPVATGMTDGIHTQITKGLQEGQEIITEIKVMSAEPEMGSSTERSPFAPGPRNRGGNRGGNSSSNRGGGR